MIDWHAIDTVLLDMDGTLLDLEYDNLLWTEHLPVRYSERHALPLEEARDRLFGKMREHHGRLEFYCLDFWTRFTGLDVVDLHHHGELTARIRYRPNAERLLGWLRASAKRAVLVTNAHRQSLAVKDSRAALVARLDAAVSCHDYGAPKESPDFWRRLADQHPFEPERTLLIDDNAQVLDAAGRHGIRHLFTIRQPDSARPPRDALAYPAIGDFAEILPND